MIKKPKYRNQEQLLDLIPHPRLELARKKTPERKAKAQEKRAHRAAKPGASAYAKANANRSTVTVPA